MLAGGSRRFGDAVPRTGKQGGMNSIYGNSVQIGLTVQTSDLLSPGHLLRHLLNQTETAKLPADFQLEATACRDGRIVGVCVMNVRAGAMDATEAMTALGGVHGALHSGDQIVVTALPLPDANPGTREREVTLRA